MGERTKRARYQQGTIRRVQRAEGCARKVRFSRIVNGLRTWRSLYFKKSSDDPTATSVYGEMETEVALLSEEIVRHKVGPRFAAVTGLYRREICSRSGIHPGSR